jgi:hypothetical protein
MPLEYRQGIILNSCRQVHADMIFDRARALREIQATHKTICMVAEVLMRSINGDGQGKGLTASPGLQF